MTGTGAGMDEQGGYGQQRQWGAGIIAMLDNWLERERDRLPLWIPVLFGAGIALWFVHGHAAATIVLLAALLLIAVGMLLPDGTRAGRICIIAGLCCAAGFLNMAMRAERASHERLDRPWAGQFYARVEGIEPQAAREQVRLILETNRKQGLPAKVRVNVDTTQFDPRITAGAIIMVKARLAPPSEPALPGAYDFAAKAWFAGIGATGSAIGPVTLIQRGERPLGLQSTRNALSAHIGHRLPGPAGAIAASLATGDQGGIAPRNAEAMRASGLAHLLSISGLHVTAMVGAVFFLLSRLLALFPWFALRVPVPLVAAAGGAVAAIGYTLITGAEVPTIRACAAALLILAALILGREAITLRLVAAGAMLVLLLWPEALAGPSFQLSFAAVTAIVCLHESSFARQFLTPRDDGFMLRWARPILSVLLTGLIIEVALMPIALFHFHKAGLYGALANMIAIPLTTFLIMPTEVIALLLDGIGPDGIGLGGPFWWLCGQAIDLLLALAHLTARQPGAVASLPVIPPWLFGLAMAGAITLALVGSRLRWAGLALLLLSLTAAWFWPRPDLMISGDGRHIAIIDQSEKQKDGAQMVLLRAGAGDYMRSMLTENAGIASAPITIDAWPGARCSADSCIIRMRTGKGTEGRDWTILATRTRHHLDAAELAAACARADIVISDRGLPRSCRPRWFRADRYRLERTGGLAVYLSHGHVETVAERTAHLPWSRLNGQDRR